MFAESGANRLSKTNKEYKMTYVQTNNITRVLAAAIESHYNALPHKRKKNINALLIAKTYVEAVKKEMIRGILRANMTQISDELIPVSFDRIRKEVHFRYSDPATSTKKYWFDFMNQTELLFKVVTLGNSITEKVTMIKTDLDLDILLVSNDHKELFYAFYKDVEHEDIEVVDIDMHSLKAYIEKTELHRDNETNENTKKTLTGHLRYAKVIYRLADFVYSQTGTYSLPQVVKESAFGRKYYTHINLQSAPRVVREAALGDCYKFDISTSVFAWKYNLVKCLTDNAPGLTYTLELLDSKKRIREHLAEVMFGHKAEWAIAVSKQVLTAVGFGAKTSSVAYIPDGFRPGHYKKTALSEIVKSQDSRAKLLNDPWFSNFIQEQQAMNNLLFDSVKTKESYLTNTNLVNENGNLLKNKTLAYMYQQSERVIIDSLTEIAKPAEVLLVVHDGFYTRTKPDVLKLKEELREFMPIASDIEYEKLTGWKNIDSTDEELHRAAIKREERDAAAFFGKAMHLPHRLPREKSTRNDDDYFNGYDDGSYSINDPMSDDFDWESYRESCEDLDDSEFDEIKRKFSKKPVLPSFISELIY
jgi:hypothetical protein